MAAIDLNSDLGENYGAGHMGYDKGMLAIVSSSNIAGGFHAGDLAGFYRTIKATAEKAWSSAPCLLSRPHWLQPPRSGRNLGRADRRCHLSDQCVEGCCRLWPVPRCVT